MISKATRARLLSGAGVVAFIYATLTIATPFVYRRLLYPAPHDSGPGDVANAKLFETRASDGQPGQMLWFEAKDGAPTLVHFHGNGESIRTETWFAEALHRRGLGVVLVEYRGYGALSGSPTEAGLYLDAIAALDALEAKGLRRDAIVLSGRSLGTGVAAEMAVRGRGAMLVLISPYTSIPEVAARFVPFLPTRALIGDEFDTLAKANGIRVTSAIIHGEDDGVVPFWMGDKLSHAIAKTSFEPVKHGHHNDLFAGERGAELFASLDRLVRDAMPSAPTPVH